MPFTSISSPQNPGRVSRGLRMVHFKLLLAVFGIVGVTVYVAYLAAETSWKYYVTADECVTQFAELNGSRVRVSGNIQPGSLNVNGERSHASFRLLGKKESLDAVCVGTLPDNLREGIDVVVEGYLQPDGALHGDKLLTKCASKYDAAPGSEMATANQRANGNPKR